MNLLFCQALSNQSILLVISNCAACYLPSDAKNVKRMSLALEIWPALFSFLLACTTSQFLGSILFLFLLHVALAIRSSDCHIWDLSPPPRVPRVKACSLLYCSPANTSVHLDNNQRDFLSQFFFSLLSLLVCYLCSWTRVYLVPAFQAS